MNIPTTKGLKSLTKIVSIHDAVHPEKNYEAPYPIQASFISSRSYLFPLSASIKRFICIKQI
ncbi:hypothetical protein [Photobacterium nomapromontoriensis]|uniref:hypothetical protein n=1 Tax=Photobacterium nomapromontoriensis TaxID=2910237 RepID=UPI003D11DE1A